MAVREFAEEFDGVTVGNVDITDAAERAAAEIDDEIRAAIEDAAENVRTFHAAQHPEDWREDFEGRELGRRYRPIESAGVYVPGGRHPLVATPAMTIVPAVVAGCWFLFALQYTGRDRRTAPVAWGAVGVLLALLVGATGTLALVGPGAPVPASTLNALLGFTVVLSTSLALLGLLLVADATAGTPAVPAGQSALLGAGVGVALALPFAATAARRPVVTPKVGSVK